MNQPAIDRIKGHIAQLENPTINYGHRMMYWRLIIDAAHEAHAAEVQQLDELKAAVADPSLSSAFGEPVV
jgi:hypothetical protein